MMDTSLEASRQQYAALRRMSIAQRLAMMDGLTELVRSMALNGVRRRHPGASESDIEARFFALTLGADLAGRVLAHRQARASGSSA